MILDASAIVAILRSEAGAQRLVDAMLAAPAVALSSVTMLEARMVMLGRSGPAAIAELDALLRDIEAEEVPFDARQSHLAFEAFRRYGKGSGHPARLNLGDCAAYALATSRDAPLLFKGDDFRATDVKDALAG